MRMIFAVLAAIASTPVCYFLTQDLLDRWQRRHEEPKEKHDEPET